MRRRIAVLLCTAALSASACDQLVATVLAGSVLIKSPELEGVVPPELLPALPLDGVVDQGATGAVLGLGERDGPTSTAAPTPMSGAEVTLDWRNRRVVLCGGDEPGTYLATSVPTASCGNRVLAYEPGEKYVLSIETADELYTVTVEPPPPVDPSAVAFTPAPSPPQDAHGVNLRRHARDTALNVDWSAAGSDQPAFVTLLRVAYRGSAGDPTGATDPANWLADADNPIFDNFPAEAGDIIALVRPGADHPQEVTIPADRFSVTGVYLVVVTPATLSTDVSNNLSLGSGAIAGQGTAFALWTE